MEIPQDVQVSFEDDVKLIVEGDMVVNGELSAQCTDMQFTVEGNLNIVGTLHNECSDETENPPGIKIVAMGEDTSFGGLEEMSEIKSSGDITVIIGPERQPWEYELSEEAYSTEELAPVCSLAADDTGIVLAEGEPAVVNFSAEGVDPDGGPVSFEWSFGDGSSSLEQYPRHAYDLPGVYTVQLTGSDDEGQSCLERMTLVVVDLEGEDDSETGSMDQLAGYILATELVVEQGSTLEFQAEVFNPLDLSLQFEWQIGDYVAGEESPVYTFESPGRYQVMLVVSNELDFSAEASGSIYVFPSVGNSSGASHLAKPWMATYDCVNPGPDVYALKNVKISGRDARFEYWPILKEMPLMIVPQAVITALDGKSFANQVKTASGAVRGQNGGKGGSIYIRNYVSDTVICGGAQLIAGSGGDGQSAISNDNEPSQFAYARGGDGGAPGGIHILVNPTQKIILQGTGFGNVQEALLTPGNSGKGGDALALAEDGKDDCQNPGKGGDAVAYGGRGGSAIYRLSFKGEYRNGGGITVDILKGKKGNAGAGGTAVAIASQGGNARQPNGNPCQAPNCAKGASGGKARAYGGKGGSARLTMNIRVKIVASEDAGIPVNLSAESPFSWAEQDVTVNATFDGGNGGDVRAEGGNGGEGATCCDQDKGSAGGRGGNGEQAPGRPGSGKPGKKGASGTALAGKNLTVAGATVITRGAGGGGDGGKGGDGKKAGGDGGASGDGRGSQAVNGGPGDRGGKCPQATAAPTSTRTSQKPQLVGLEFPVGNPLDLWHGEYASIPADGSDVIGKVYFQDPDGDMSYAYFEPLEDDSPFSSFGFYLNELYAEDLEGDEYEGAFLFWISCTTQGQHSFGVSLQDEAGNWSQWGVLIFQCK